MEKKVYKVEPIVIYPRCIQLTGKQSNCHICHNQSECVISQPRSMCIKSYKDHKNGCPNFGVLPTCPPQIPCMYDEIFDCSDVWAVVTKFDLYKHYAKMREKNPNLAEGQIRNRRIWQPISKKENDYAISEFYQENPDKKDYVATRLLECMGVDVVNTMKKVGVEIKFPVEEYALRVAFLAKIYEGVLTKYGFEIKEEKCKQKKGILSLVKKKELV